MQTTNELPSFSTLFAEPIRANLHSARREKGPADPSTSTASTTTTCTSYYGTSMKGRWPVRIALGPHRKSYRFMAPANFTRVPCSGSARTRDLPRAVAMEWPNLGRAPHNLSRR